MSKNSSHSTLYFWLLIAISVSVVGFGLALSWAYSQEWMQTLWHICRVQLQEVEEHLPPVWQLIIPTLLLVVTLRGSWSMFQQTRATLRLARLFVPLHETPPARVRALLAPHGLALEDVIFLNLAVAHAFCLGFWKPRIWLTAGLVNLLTDEELASVLAHEAHHCRQRDPLRLLIGRALTSAFFFLPLVRDLAKMVELHQEVAADHAAITQLGSDLPLLRTLQKLLKKGVAGTGLPMAAYSPFHVTEARIRRLIYPPPPFNWRTYLAGGLINLGILLLLGSVVSLSAPSPPSPVELDHCVAEPAVAHQSPSSLLNYQGL